jgi:hypothetical protein
MQTGPLEQHPIELTDRKTPRVGDVFAGLYRLVWQWKAGDAIQNATRGSENTGALAMHEGRDNRLAVLTKDILLALLLVQETPRYHLMEDTHHRGALEEVTEITVQLTSIYSMMDTYAATSAPAILAT